MDGRGRFEAGDGIRGLAVAAILVWHAAAFTLVFENREHSVARLGADGRPLHEAWPQAGVEALVLLSQAVWLFFALSGYLIARPFAAAWVAGAPRPSLRRYARNRVVRIVPAMWAAIALTVLVHGTGGDGPRELLAVLGFAQLWAPGHVARQMPHAWTLEVEAAFYVAVALVVLGLGVLRPRRAAVRRAVLLALVGAAALASVLVIRRAAHGGLGAWEGTPAAMLGGYGIAFVPGLLLAALEPWAAPRVRARPGLGRALAAGLLAVAAAAALASALNGAEHPLRERAVLSVLAGAAVAACVAREWGGARPWLAGRTWRWLGERSYSIYLLHLLVLFGLVDALDALGWPPGAAAAVAVTAGVPLAIGAGWALHRMVEAPALRLRAAPRGGATRRPPAGGAAPRAASSSASPR